MKTSTDTKVYKASIANPSSLEYLNTEQAAEYLQVSTQWLEIGRVKGYGPNFIKLGRLVRYKRTSIDEYLEKHQVDNTIQGGSHE
jgi:predicted DNA-binding transcriptional regulator AlpA